MPFSDLSDAILNTDTADRFQVIRRLDDVSPITGRTAPTPVPGSPFFAVGVVTPASPKQLDRLSDEDQGKKAISIVTRFRLQLPSPGVKPDVVVWPYRPVAAQNNYLVAYQDDLTRFGAGFVTVVAVLMDAQPAPPSPLAPGISQPIQPPEC